MSKPKRSGPALKLKDVAVGDDAASDGDGPVGFPEHRVGDLVKHGRAG